jgi:G3E family GTPase
MQIEWRKLLGTGSFSKMNTAAKPLAPGASPRDSNFEDAVSSFVYESRMPFHPERLYKFVTENFNLHQRDWAEEITQNAKDALTTIREAAAAIAVAAKMLPMHKASLQRAAELASSAAALAVEEAESAGALDSMHCAVEKLATGSMSASSKLRFGNILRSKGQVWLAGSTRYDHLGDWSLAGDVLQFTSGGPWISRLPLSHWPQDESKREEILKDLAPGIGDRWATRSCTAAANQMNLSHPMHPLLCLV